VSLVPIVTEGDRLAGNLGAAGGKGLFTRALEYRLIEGAIDFAVHSLKDLPVVLPEGLELVAFPPREDPRDVLLSHLGASLDELPPGATILTGSLRRSAQILARNPRLKIESIRGNIDSRIRKWQRGRAAALVIASAGLARLGLLHDPTLDAKPIPPDVMIPAPGQGILALEVRAGSEAAELCRALNDEATAQSALAEREVVRSFGGDCTLPLAAWGRWKPGAFSLSALLATPDGKRVARAERSGADPQQVARACVEAMHEAGAATILDVLRRAPSLEPGS
jgi:hydroxymethylbilane synthase